MKRYRRAISYLLLMIVGFAFLFLARWSRTPVLEVYYSPEAAGAVNWQDFEYPLQRAGVERIRLIEKEPTDELMGETDDCVRIGIALSAERNPALTQEMIARGLTGPGYTIGRIGYVYKPDIELFLKKHWRTLDLDHRNLDEVRKRLITNTAAHEAWHAICQSTSHNPLDVDSLMYMNPSGSPRTYCLDRPLFTKGHLKRLQERFRVGYKL